MAASARRGDRRRRNDDGRRDGIDGGNAFGSATSSANNAMSFLRARGRARNGAGAARREARGWREAGIEAWRGRATRIEAGIVAWRGIAAGIAASVGRAVESGIIASAATMEATPSFRLRNNARAYEGIANVVLAR